MFDQLVEIVDDLFLQLTRLGRSIGLGGPLLGTTHQRGDPRKRVVVRAQPHVFAQLTLQLAIKIALCLGVGAFLGVVAGIAVTSIAVTSIAAEVEIEQVVL